MHTHGSDGHHGLGAAAREVVEHGMSIAKLELRLALAELKTRLAMLGIGIALVLGAAICGGLALLLAVATVVSAIATALPVWLALLIVTGATGVLAGLLGALALGALRRASPPVPKQAIEEARLTAEAVKGDGHARVA